MLAIKAKCDGRKVVLPGKKHFPVGSVIVVFEIPGVAGDEQTDWQNLSRKHLADAYGTNEPDYSKHLLKESNAEYKPSKKARLS
jgi:hypothetical protein